VIKALTEGLAGNRMKRVMGVMNGTCNYILTRMQAENLPYETVFEEARQLGYLEADPNLDVGGIDAGHKLSLLAGHRLRHPCQPSTPWSWKASAMSRSTTSAWPRTWATASSFSAWRR
jgi:homoserine dehydrogenase